MDEFLQKPLERRMYESKTLKLKYTDRVPVIVKPGTPQIEKFKYLVPKNVTVAEFVNVIRKQIKIRSFQALFVLVGGEGTLPVSKATMGQVYEEHRNEDGFLYITYSLENTFGSK
jgi:GABA(A) receptor-associated protein